MTISDTDLIELSNQHCELIGKKALLISLLKSVRRFEMDCLECGDYKTFRFGKQIDALISEEVGNCRVEVGLVAS
ncbi:MAG: hypothetical protein KME60_13520 [Cyanomargarita calcarea GSE-NOS-MK-12-04C]|jgi:hypothetical protein|uniref:Uncharacterized protein n=1 Tax=Cyanomargarita calcarea GSE-NOS-MK-12-04C TaxID=2839659 RepID=A0A951QNU5_9CYAN|nr:hypothetical protein [Cyanomargarita calcarea GSE-NOS-MK-12-04C]